MVEYYKKNAENEIETKNGQFDVNDGVTLNYKRDENGEFSFEDWSNGKKFGSTLRSIDAELPNNCKLMIWIDFKHRVIFVQFQSRKTTKKFCLI